VFCVEVDVLMYQRIVSVRTFTHTNINKEARVSNTYAVLANTCFKHVATQLIVFIT